MGITMDKNTSIRAECVQMFRRLDEKLDGLISRADRINGRYEKHMIDGEVYRKSVLRHEHLLELMEKEKLNTNKASQWRIGLIVGGLCSGVTILMSLVSFYAGR
jgi:hypothetical protein